MDKLWRRAVVGETDSSDWQTPLAEQLSLLQDAGRMGLWERDLRTGVGRWDWHCFRLFGFEPGPTAPPYDVAMSRIHPDDRDAVLEHHRLLAQNPGRSEVRFRLQHPDGRLRHLHSMAEVRCDANGRSVLMLGVVIDDTIGVERAQAEQGLRERMAQMADAAGLGLWTREVGTSHSEWNAQMYRIHHRDPSLGAPTLDEWLTHHLHPLDRERFEREVRRADDEWKPTFDIEFRIPAPDGSVRWVYSWGRREIRDGRRVAFGIHIDITDRRSAEFELRRQRERARFALEAASVGVWERTFEGEPLYWSEGMYALRGLTPNDPRSLSEIAVDSVHPDDRSALDELARRHASVGVPYEAEFRVLWPDGSTHWLATRGQAVRSADGTPLYLTGVNLDITSRRESEAVLREKHRIEQASRAKSEFMARMSHELRTPMNAVLGFAELLSEDTVDTPTPRQRERLSRIRAAGEHLLALINDVLDLTSLDVDDRALAPEAVMLDRLARDALQWVAALAEHHHVVLRAAPMQGCVLAERRRLGQIAANLLSNAIKYNKRGGWVEVSSQRRMVGGVVQHALVVRDSGRGMSAQQMKRLFEPFERLGAEQQDIEGTGIGLTIVRQLVDRMSGRIEVSSRPGVGSEFRVWLPEAHVAPEIAVASDEPPRRQAEPTSPPLAVLCVEDNPVNLMLVRELFALRPSMHLATASDGATGIALAIDSPPDLVLLDLQLPDMSGLDVLRRLRAERALVHSRIVALSANAIPADVRAALEAGFDDYWTKPIDIPRFLAGIDAFAAQHAAMEPGAHVPT